VTYWLARMQKKLQGQQPPPTRELASLESKARAQASLKRREEHKIDAPKAMREYRDAEQAARDRITTLKAVRLARDAAVKP
jgi:hypothetical protein